MCHFSSPHSWPITCSKSVWCQTQFPVRTLNYKYIKLTLHTYHCHSVIRLWIHLIFKIKPVELQMIYIISSDHSKKNGYSCSSKCKVTVIYIQNPAFLLYNQLLNFNLNHSKISGEEPPTQSASYQWGGGGYGEGGAAGIWGSQLQTRMETTTPIWVGLSARSQELSQIIHTFRSVPKDRAPSQLWGTPHQWNIICEHQTKPGVGDQLKKDQEDKTPVRSF